MTDQELIYRNDALAACDIAPPDEWNDYTKGGYDFAAEECKRNIATLPAIDPAAIREAALREAADACQRIAGNTLAFYADHRRAAGQCAAMILALIGETK